MIGGIFSKPAFPGQCDSLDRNTILPSGSKSPSNLRIKLKCASVFTAMVSSSPSWENLTPSLSDHVKALQMIAAILGSFPARISEEIFWEKAAMLERLARSRVSMRTVALGCLATVLSSCEVFGSLEDGLRTVRRSVCEGYVESA